MNIYKGYGLSLQQAIDNLRLMIVDHNGLNQLPQLYDDGQYIYILDWYSAEGKSKAYMIYSKTETKPHLEYWICYINTALAVYLDIKK